MTLNIIWFILIAVLYAAFFVLEGFDFGIGILLPFLGKDDTERRTIINTIGPHWDGNEVWLITAGGATFAAFPHWYATLFSGFYLPLFLLLMALIVRGVSFEFRSKDEHTLWRKFWDWAIFTSSLLASFLLGVAFSNIVRGVPINEKLQYTGGFFNLLNPYALLGGLTVVFVFALHGAIFLNLKTTADLLAKSRWIAAQYWLPVAFLFLAFVIYTFFATDILSHNGFIKSLIPIVAVVAVGCVGGLIKRRRDGWAFVFSGVGIVAMVCTFFAILYPRVMISTLNPDWSLTIANAASGPQTLKIMTIVAAILIPIILAYTAWSYWIFRKRLEAKPEILTY